MSNCRCSDIENCKRDIRTLNDANNALREYQEQIADIFECLIYLEIDSGQAFDADNMRKLIFAIHTLVNDMRSVRETFRSKIGSRIRELESELSDMEEEDADYHSEEEDDEIFSLPDETTGR